MAKLANVNTTNIEAAIALGCRTMQRVFNADDNEIPFFKSRVYPDTILAFNPNHSESHVPGRHLNALLNAEDVANIELDERAVQKHARAAFFSFSGKLPLPLNRQQVDGPLTRFVPHNLREGMHALYSLVKYRDCPRAQALAERMIATVSRYWRPEHRWWRQDFEKQGLVLRESDTFIFGEARLIGPLVKYYRATGYGPALDLALTLKEKAISEFFREDGAYEPETLGNHSHSITCVISSLAQLADLTHDSTLMNRVRAFYDNGLWQLRDELGWVIETYPAMDHSADRGEVNSTGDVVETALILGRWGYPQYFHDAERIIRGHLLPSQLRDNSFITEPSNAENIDAKRCFADRHLGAYGCPAPYGHQPMGFENIVFNMDIVGGAVGSLCEVMREATRMDEAGHWVNLFFDHETDVIQVQSPYTYDRLYIKVKQPRPLFIRIPPWLDTDKLISGGVDDGMRKANGYWFIARPPVNQSIAIGFDLPEQTLVLKHHTRNIRVRMRGNEVIAMENFGTDFTFFESFT